ncbi:MAG: MOSC domain-containing protein [Deltaproteobacteria bacterium]
MQLISVNIGKPVPFEHTRPGVTGIFKIPVSGPVQVNTLGLEGDAIIDTANHGGRDQAVYVYFREDYDWWEAELGRPLVPGTFGENLTISGMSSRGSLVGDRFTIGGVVLEVTSPRIPCRTFAARMEDKFFVKKFLAADRPGVYCRVLAEGQIESGTAVQFDRFAGAAVPVIEMCHSWNRSDLDDATIARYLAAPIHEKERQRWQKDLST